MNKYKKFSRKAQAANKKLHACERKIPFNTEQEAYQKGMRIYCCPHCGKFHRATEISKIIAKAKS